MSKNYIAIFVAIVMAAVSGNTIAADDQGTDQDREKRSGKFRGPDRGHGDPAAMIERMAMHLDLDDVQRQSIANIVDASKPEFDALRTASRTNREEIQTLDVTDPDYGAKLQNLSVQSGELAAGLTLLAGRVRSEIAAVLTADQLEAFKARRSRMGEHRRSFRQDRSR